MRPYISDFVVQLRSRQVLRHDETPAALVQLGQVLAKQPSMVTLSSEKQLGNYRQTCFRIDTMPIKGQRTSQLRREILDAAGGNHKVVLPKSTEEADDEGQESDKSEAQALQNSDTTSIPEKKKKRKAQANEGNTSPTKKQKKSKYQTPTESWKVLVCVTSFLVTYTNLLSLLLC